MAQADLTGMAIPALEKIKPADLPAPPQAALEMLRACSRDDVDQRVLANFAETDPVLTAELLRVVNTPLFGMAKEVTSVRHAIVILGAKTLRNIILCLMVRESIQSLNLDGFDITGFWEDTLRRATVARYLARLLKLDSETAFTAGLLQDFGLLALFYLQQDIAQEFNHLRSLEPLQRLEQENQLFGIDHVAVFEQLAKLWSIPDKITQPVIGHHRVQDDEVLAEILHLADWANLVFNVPDVANVFEQVQQKIQTSLTLSAEQVQQMFEELPVLIEEAASSMGLRINQQVNFEQLLRQASSQLAKASQSYQELSWQLEKAIEQRDKLAQELNQEILIAQEVQRKLMPEEGEDMPICGINYPARNISGDFYDFLRLKDGRIWFALGDVSGKGINAGILMAKTASLFRCLAKRMSNPAQLVQIINNELCESATRGFFVTLVVGLFSPKDNMLSLVNAGHLPAIVIDKHDKVVTLTADAPPVGILPNTQYACGKAISLQDSAVYLYSDGVTESQTNEKEHLQLEGLVELIRQHRAIPAKQRLTTIAETVLQCGKQQDDITLLILEP